MPKKGKMRAIYIWTVHQGASDGERKWSKTTQDMPQTADDTDGDVEEAETAKRRQMETANKYHDQGKLGKRKQEKYTTTWTRPGGNISRQIDYIMINAKHRNVARQAQNNTHWGGNLHQNQQHRVQTMQLYFSAAEKYKKPIPAESGKNSNMTSTNSACVRKN